MPKLGSTNIIFLSRISHTSSRKNLSNFFLVLFCNLKENAKTMPSHFRRVLHFPRGNNRLSRPKVAGVKRAGRERQLNGPHAGYAFALILFVIKQLKNH